MCFSSSGEMWCYKMKTEPQEKTCEYFNEIPEIISHLRNYVMQKHI